MRLYFNGASFTYGDELDDPSNSSYPTVMARQLELQFVNDAVQGGTNQRTVYTTIQNIKDFDCFIIAWTNYNRFTEYNPVDNFEINFSPQLDLSPALHHSNDLKINYAKYKDYAVMYYKYWYNELYSFKQWLQQILLMQSFFKEHNKKFIMLNSVDNQLDQWCSPREDFISSVKSLLDFFDYHNDDQLLAEYDRIHDMISLIDHSNFVEFSTWCITDYNKEFPHGPGGHPLEDGHIAIADKLINFYNKRYV